MARFFLLDFSTWIKNWFHYKLFLYCLFQKQQHSWHHLQLQGDQHESRLWLAVWRHRFTYHRRGLQHQHLPHVCISRPTRLWYHYHIIHSAGVSHCWHRNNTSHICHRHSHQSVFSSCSLFFIRICCFFVSHFLFDWNYYVWLDFPKSLTLFVWLKLLCVISFSKKSIIDSIGQFENRLL